MGLKWRAGALAIMLLLAGCYRTTPQAINEIANASNPICPFKDGVYYVRSGTIDGSVIIATIVINGVAAAGGGENCAAKILVLDNKSAKAKIEDIFTRRFSALDEGIQVAYNYPASAKPNINYIRSVGRLYEVYSECNSDINSACGVLKTAKDIKDQAHYLASTEKARELLIRQEVRMNGANELDLVSMVQTPNYIIVPKFFKP